MTEEQIIGSRSNKSFRINVGRRQKRVRDDP